MIEIIKHILISLNENNEKELSSPIDTAFRVIWLNIHHNITKLVSRKVYLVSSNSHLLNWLNISKTIA